MRANNLKEILGAERRDEHWWIELPDEIWIDGLLPNLTDILYKARAAGRDLIQFSTLDQDGLSVVVRSPLVYASAASYLERVPVLDLIAYKNYLRMVVATNLSGMELSPTTVERALHDREFGYYVEVSFVSEDEVHVGVLIPTATSHFRASAWTEQQLKHQLECLYFKDQNGVPLAIKTNAMADLGLAYYVWPGLCGRRDLEALRTDLPDMRLVINRSQLPV